MALPRPGSPKTGEYPWRFGRRFFKSHLNPPRVCHRTSALAGIKDVFFISLCFIPAA